MIIMDSTTTKNITDAEQRLSEKLKTAENTQQFPLAAGESSEAVCFTAVIEDIASDGQIAVNRNGVIVPAQPCFSLFFVPVAGDMVLCAETRGVVYITQLLAQAPDKTADVRSLSLPAKSVIKCSEELSVMTPRLRTVASEIDVKADRLTERVRNRYVSAQTARLEADTYDLRARQSKVSAELLKTNVTGVASVSAATMVTKVTGSSVVNVGELKVSADGNVEVDGKKINFG